MNKLLCASVFVIALSTPAFAQQLVAPNQVINPTQQPYLAQAQMLANEAYLNITAAQTANNFDMGGHAQQALELLQQVNEQLLQSATLANANKPK